MCIFTLICPACPDHSSMGAGSRACALEIPAVWVKEAPSSGNGIRPPDQGQRLYMVKPLLISHSSLSLPSSSTHMTCLLLKYSKLLSISGPWHMFLLHLLPLILPIAGFSSNSSRPWQPQLSNSHLSSPSLLTHPGKSPSEIINLIYSFTNFLSLSTHHYPLNSKLHKGNTSVLFTMLPNTEPVT